MPLQKTVEEMEPNLRELPASEIENTPKTCHPTLHAFGKDIIAENYERADLAYPETVRRDRSITQRTRQMNTKPDTEVAILKIETRDR